MLTGPFSRDISIKLENGIGLFQRFINEKYEHIFFY